MVKLVGKLFHLKDSFMLVKVLNLIPEVRTCIKGLKKRLKTIQKCFERTERMKNLSVLIVDSS